MFLCTGKRERAPLPVTQNICPNPVLISEKIRQYIQHKVVSANQDSKLALGLSILGLNMFDKTFASASWRWHALFFRICSGLKYSKFAITII